MPLDNSPAAVVTRFLRTQGYEETLSVFLKEAGLALDTGSDSGLTVETLLAEKNLYDLSINFEKIGSEDNTDKWKIPAPEAAVHRELGNSANLLQVSVAALQLPGSLIVEEALLATTADKTLTILSLDSSKSNTLHTLAGISDSPILSCIVLAKRFLAWTGISGSLFIYDLFKDEVVTRRKPHTKYGVSIISKQVSSDRFLIATAGWDNKINLYNLSISDNKVTLGEPFGTIQMSSNPESILFVNRPEDDAILLLASRRDSTFLYYYDLSSYIGAESLGNSLLAEVGKQNLAPYANSWVSFTPSAIALCPTDSTLVAVATTSIPYMKLLIVRLIFPRIKELDNEGQHPTQTDDEAAAILLHCSTMVSQTQYSTPTVAWRPDGSGIWTNSEDGVIRGIEARTGKIVSRLQGHVPGMKVRCLWAGIVRGTQEDGEEWLVSGGFDQRLLVWKKS